VIKKDLTLDKWYRMDNSAVIYPMSITPATQSLFRLTAELKSHIDEELLQAAVINILPRFPSFKVQLRSGFFRYYFDDNEHKPLVFRDNGILHQKINFSQNNHFLFRICYFKRKISADFFHALCDGSGAMEFMKALVFQYLRETGIALLPDEKIKLAEDEPLVEEQEDSFVKHAKKLRISSGAIARLAGTTAVQIRGKKFRGLGYGLIQGNLIAEELAALSKKYKCSVTVLVAANALLSVAETLPQGNHKHDLVVMIPVDLRRFFKSSTLNNFTTVVRCSVNPNRLPLTLRDYCRHIQEQLKAQLDKEGLEEKLSLATVMGLKWYMKIMPLALKSFFIKLGKLLSGETKQTMIVSNLGIATMPDGTEEYLDSFAFNPNVSFKAPKNIGLVSYEGKTTISFTRAIVSTEIERRFFTRLSKEGLSVEIISNLREVSANFMP